MRGIHDHSRRILAPSSDGGSAAAVSPDDHAVAHRLAQEAGELLVDLRVGLTLEGADQHRIKDAGDRESHVWLMDALAKERPDDAVLSEEGADDLDRLRFSRAWIIDPLDGTREYGEGRSDWAVHVGLSIDGVPLIGAVSLPSMEIVLSTAVPPVVPERPEDRPIRLVVSRSRAPYVAHAVAEALDAEFLQMGSAGAKAMAVVLGHADIYVHAGGQYEWDNCAPAAVALAAGLHASRIDGSPLRYNNADPYLPDLLICRPEFAGPALEVISRLF
jgi:3'(2'), 5'-bisphosphate nucleotidase